MKPSVIHMFDPNVHVSPFDINMAVDAGFDQVIPYSGVKPEEMERLVQDVIFSRGPEGVKRTTIFIGGRDLGVAMDMFETCSKTMFEPFEVSVLADPSGAFTTAAALVACVEFQLREKHRKELKDCRAVVFGGTGVVGAATAVLTALNGAKTTIVDHLSIETAQAAAEEHQRRCNCEIKGTFAASEAEKARLIRNADLVFCAAKAGIQVLDASVLEDATQLKVAGDVNAVKPLGIEGIERKDFGAPLKYATGSPGAVGVGALAVGDIKYKLQQKQLRLALTTGPVLIDFRDGLNQARELIKG